MDVKVNWLIEDVDVKDDVNRLVSALEKSNTNYVITKTNDALKHFKEDDCVISYGSLHFINFVRSQAKYIPNVWIDFEALRCHKYLTHLHDYSIHKVYGFHTLGQIIRDSNRIFKMYGDFRNVYNKHIFIKPDVGYKYFSGQIVVDFEFADFVSSIIHLDEEMLCLVSAPSEYDIVKEFRFYVTQEKVITGSQYQPEVKEGYDEKAVEYIDKFREYYFSRENSKFTTPHPIVVDIGLLSNGTYRLIELGGFNSAGLYACDYDKLVEECNRLAELEWKSFYEDDVVVKHWLDIEQHPELLTV